jgi:hypothetical protein
MFFSGLGTSDFLLQYQHGSGHCHHVSLYRHYMQLNNCTNMYVHSLVFPLSFGFVIPFIFSSPAVPTMATADGATCTSLGYIYGGARVDVYADCTSPTTIPAAVAAIGGLFTAVNAVGPGNSPVSCSPSNPFEFSMTLFNFATLKTTVNCSNNDAVYVCNYNSSITGISSLCLARTLF